MFAQAYQSGYISVLYSVGSRPLQLWEKHSTPQTDGVRRVLDEDIQSAVIEISADTDAATAGDADALSSTWVRCPARGVTESLHIRLPQLVFQLKPLPTDRHVAIEIHVQDDVHELRRFRLATYQRATVVHSLMTLLPLRLDGGVWNQLQVDLPQLTLETYGSRYVHTVSIQIHAHCRVRRVFFADRMSAENALPVEFRLYKRLTKQRIVQLKTGEADA